MLNIKQLLFITALWLSTALCAASLAQSQSSLRC
jgi:hypothetical protein